jgi:membrane protein involved in D-alanine export
VAIESGARTAISRPFCRLRPTPADIGRFPSRTGDETAASAGTLAGPIDRFRRFERDWNVERDRAAFLADLDGAVQRIVRGFFYKFLMARMVQRHWMNAAAVGTGFGATLSYMYAYSFYLFFDFAGYSAFAIGFSYLFGVHTPENFDKPFLAKNIRDFWNRWHVTLSAWFRDHVYTRFVLAAAKGRWFSDIRTASYLGLFGAMGLMGLWHGTTWYYVVYGVYHGALLVGHDVFVRWNKESRLWGDGPVWQLAGSFVTFHAVAFGFLVFSGRLAQS